MLSDLIRDLRYALRMLAAAPTFTAVVVITLALGVGANALIFTAVDAILLRSPGIADPDGLVSVYNSGTDGQTGQAQFSTVSFPDYADVRDAGIFQDVGRLRGHLGVARQRCGNRVDRRASSSPATTFRSWASHRPTGAPSPPTRIGAAHPCTSPSSRTPSGRTGSAPRRRQSAARSI